MTSFRKWSTFSNQNNKFFKNMYTFPHWLLLWEKALWSLANILDLAAEFRDMIVLHGGLYPILQIAEKSKNQWLVHDATLAIHEMLKKTPHLDIRHFLHAIPVLCKIIKNSQHEETLASSLPGLFYFLSSKDSRPLVVSCEITSILFSLLRFLFLFLCWYSHVLGIRLSRF